MSLVKFASDAMEISLGYDVSPLEGFATKLAAEAAEGDTYGKNIGAGALLGSAISGGTLGVASGISAFREARNVGKLGRGKAALAGLGAGLLSGVGGAIAGGIAGGIDGSLYGGAIRLSRGASAVNGSVPDSYGVNTALGMAFNTIPGLVAYPKAGLKYHGKNMLAGAAFGAGAKYIRDKWNEK